MVVNDKTEIRLGAAPENMSDVKYWDNKNLLR